MKQLKLLIISSILLTGCSPNPITDTQMKIISEQCKDKGLVISIFNSPLVSRAECIEVTDKK